MIYMLTVISISLFFLITNYIKNKEFNIIVLFFNILWSAITYIFYLNSGYESVQSTSLVYLLIIFLVFFMNLGFIIFMPSSKNYIEKKVFEENFINSRILVGLLFLCILLILLFMRRVAEPLLSGDLTAIRKMIYSSEVGSENSLYGSGLEIILIQWIANSMILAIFIVVTVLFITGKSNYRLLLLSFIAGLLFALLTGGRMMLLKLIIILFSAITLFKFNDIKMIIKTSIIEITNKRKKKLFFFISSIALLAILFTSMRNEPYPTSISPMQSIMSYILSPILYFHTLLKTSEFSTEYLLGGAFWGGLLRPIDLVLENITGKYITFPSDVLINETQNFVYLSNGTLYNALPTMLYAFYRDLGIIGVILCSITITLFVSYTYKMFLERRTIRSMSLYVLSFYIILMGALRWEPSYIQFWLTLLFILIITNKKINAFFN